MSYPQLVVPLCFWKSWIHLCLLGFISGEVKLYQWAMRLKHSQWSQIHSIVVEMFTSQAGGQRFNSQSGYKTGCPSCSKNVRVGQCKLHSFKFPSWALEEKVQWSKHDEDFLPKFFFPFQNPTVLSALISCMTKLYSTLQVK